MSSTILNNLNSTSYIRLRRTPEVVPPEVVPLHVNRTCVNGSHVSTGNMYRSFKLNFLQSELQLRKADGTNSLADVSLTIMKDEYRSIGK